MKFRLAYLLMVTVCFSGWTAKVKRFTPTGSVKKVQQVVVVFDTEVVALGSPSQAAPFQLDCHKGKDPFRSESTSRWIDGKTWLLELKEALPSGVQCTAVSNVEFKDLKGNPTDTSTSRFSFSTGGPQIVDVTPSSRIEPDQFFVLNLDSPVQATSVVHKCFFEVEGLSEKVPCVVVKGADRETILRFTIQDQWRFKDLRPLLKQKQIRNAKEFSSLVILKAGRHFPENAKVVLHWPKGILSQAGVTSDTAQSFTFQVVEPFRAQFTCERNQPQSPCNPIQDFSLNFSAYVPIAQLKGTQLVSHQGQVWNPEELSSKASRSTTISRLTFKGPFPEQSQFQLTIPPRLLDEAGRKLQNQAKFPLSLATDEYSPLVKFSATFGILELQADPALPVSVRNVEAVLSGEALAIEGNSFSMNRLEQAKEIVRYYKEVKEKENNYRLRNTPLLPTGKGRSFTLPKPLGARALELIGIPLPTPGFHVVELASPKLGQALTESGTMYVASSALVTNLAVHLKQGREGSLVWVTQLSDTKPVSQAEVVILSHLGEEKARGRTNDKGIFSTGPLTCSKEPNESDYTEESTCELFAFAQKNSDLSFTSSYWSKGIETYRFNVSTEYLSKQWGPSVLHTILDRVVAQPGDVIHLKHILRERRATGFSFLSPRFLPKKVFVVHHGSQKVYSLPFNFDSSTQTALNEFHLPKEASLGNYSVYLSNRDTPPKEVSEGERLHWSDQATAQFTVAQYRLPNMKATAKIVGRNLVQPKSVQVDLSAHYLSGGPAKQLATKVRAYLRPSYFSPELPGGSDYTFLSEALRVGLQKDRSSSSTSNYLKLVDVTLNEKGGALVSLDRLPKVSKIEELAVEMEYMDPSGEIKTTSTQTLLFPARYVVGLKSQNWYSTGGTAKVFGIVLTSEGKVAPGRSYSIEAFKTDYFTHRKRLVGGFYSYDYQSKVTSLGNVCKGTSDLSGRFECEPKNLPAGSVTLQARVNDDQNRSTYAQAGLSIYEPGKDSWWVPSDSDRIDLIPDKLHYEPNESATLVVRTPFASASALVTVEREGILDHFIQEVPREMPFITIPLKGHYAPNVFVSVLLIRGRLAKPQATAFLDLSRPALKMGLTELKVGWKSHELVLDVNTSKARYQPHETVQVSVSVRTPTGDRLPSPTDLAVGVVDESLLLLRENFSWNILQAMMGQRPLSVSTSSGQNQVMGRRHFGAKAKPPGGGGGEMAGDARQLFEPVVFWQPHVKVDDQGKAALSFTLNDSISRFRIVALAQSGTSFFGYAKTSVESTKDLILYSGLPPSVYERDQVQATVTVRNTTPKPMNVEVKVKAAPLETSEVPHISLEPHTSKVVSIPLLIPQDLTKLTVEVEARDLQSTARDMIKTNLAVLPTLPPRVIQATLTQLDPKKRETFSVQEPIDNVNAKGGLQLTVSPTLVSGLSGVKQYMEQYPYSCLEQRLSKNVVLENKAELQQIVGDLPAYQDKEGLFKFFPTSVCGSAQLSQYVLTILKESQIQVPLSTLEAALNGLRNFAQGKTTCRTWWDEFSSRQYQDELKILILDTLSRYKAFDPSLLSLFKPSPMLWKTETLLAWTQLLQREEAIAHRKEMLTEAQTQLRARIAVQGTSWTVQNDLDNEARWTLFTSPDQQSARMLAYALSHEDWFPDAAKLTRGLLAHLNSGHWDTTLSNAWGSLVLRQFSRQFEKDPVTGTTRLTSPGKESLVAFTQGTDQRVVHPWPTEKKAFDLSYAHEGLGKPWLFIQSMAAIALNGPLDMGYAIQRTISPVVQNKKGEWKVGDVAQIELTITAKSDQPWVAVKDPVPSGVAHLNTGLEGTSQILDKAPASTNTIKSWPTEYDEKYFASYISYAAYLPKGVYTVQYRVRLNTAGTFYLPPSRVEALYSPELFGEVPNEPWIIQP